MSNVVKEFNARVEAAVTSLKAVQAALQTGLPKGKPAAQVASMVAYAAAKKAGELINEIKQGLELMTQADATDQNANPPVVIDQRVVAALASQFDMDKDAVTPFMIEANSVMLALV